MQTFHKILRKDHLKCVRELNVMKEKGENITSQDFKERANATNVPIVDGTFIDIFSITYIHALGPISAKGFAIMHSKNKIF